jgi:hypothetical protein
MDEGEDVYVEWDGVIDLPPPHIIATYAMVEKGLWEDVREFVLHAEHDAGCSGGFGEVPIGAPRYRCKCGLRSLRDRLERNGEM